MIIKVMKTFSIPHLWLLIRIWSWNLSNPSSMHTEPIETRKVIPPPIVQHPQHNDTEINTQFSNLWQYRESLHVMRRVDIICEIRKPNIF